MASFINYLITAIINIIDVAGQSISYGGGTVSILGMFMFTLIFEVIIGALMSVSRVERPRKHAREGDSDAR